MRSFLSKAICLLLVVLMSFMTACSRAANSGAFDSHAETTVPSSQNTSSHWGTRTTSISTSKDITEIPVMEDDDSFADYDDAEAFIYNLIYSDLSAEYDTFTGYIALSGDEEDEVYGICYTDYEEGYLGADNRVFFSAGFVRFASEPLLDEVAIQSGLEIHSLDETDDVYSYVYTYASNDIHKHCVIDGKYVKYDIVDGNIQYSEEEYLQGMDVDLSRGNIFNYDTGEYDYYVETNEYVPITGVSLIGETDYQAIIEEVNRILTSQEANLSYQEIESFVTQSQAALYSYLLGIQEETFMGIPTAQLVEIVKDLNPMQHLQIGVDENGNTTIHVIEVTKLATLWEKIATSLVCAFGIVSGVLLTTINPAFAGALIGASMEAFSQVVINSTPVTDIQWAQVAVAAACGSISGAITGALGGWGANIFVKEVIDTVCDGFIGGGEFFINALIAGQSFEEACNHFGYGMLTAVLISGGVKVAKAVIKGGARLVNKINSRMVESIGDTQVTTLSKEAVEYEAVKKSAKAGATETLGKSVDSVNAPKPSKKAIITEAGSQHICYGDEGFGIDNMNGGHSYKVYADIKAGKYPNITYTEYPVGQGGITKIKYKLVTPDGTIRSGTKTFFPDSFSENDILSSVRKAGSGNMGSYDPNHNSFQFKKHIKAIDIIVGKTEDGIIKTGYPYYIPIQ